MSKKIDVFWDAVSDGTTLDEIADGIDVEFIYKHEKYKINTSGGSQCRIKPIEQYYSELEAKVESSKPIDF